jgi:hypothetical protein
MYAGLVVVARAGGGLGESQVPILSAGQSRDAPVHEEHAERNLNCPASNVLFQALFSSRHEYCVAEGELGNCK